MVRRLGSSAALLFVMLVGLGLAGCSQSDFSRAVGVDAQDDGGVGDDGPKGPGQAARDERDVTCDSDDDCIQGEACVDAVCQMPRCKDGPYVSDAPLRASLKLFSDEEILVADAAPDGGRYYVDGFSPEPGSIEYPGSWDVAGAKIVDLAGGDFFGTGEGSFVIATEGSTSIEVVGTDPVTVIDVGFAPAALAAGDTDRDGVDEVVALGRFGNVALCRIPEGSCSTFIIQNGNGVDVTMGDVDGDGFEEVIMLLDQNGTAIVFVWAVDAPFTGDQDFHAVAGAELKRIDAGDLDGDGAVEIVGFTQGGWFGDAKLHVYAARGEIAPLYEQVIAKDARDLMLADLDADRREELVILREGRTIELFEAGEGTTIVSSVLTHVLPVGADPDRIDASDIDHDSPRTRLMNDEGVLLAGPVTPLVVAHFPPYDAERSRELPAIVLGSTESQSESFSDTVSLRTTFDVGVSASFFGLFKAKVGTRVQSEIKHTQTTSTSFDIGRRISASPDPEVAGNDYGVVTLACACYHAYYYEVRDPAARLGAGANGEQFVMVMPVAGTTTAWSSKRYNAMAEAVGNLPLVEIPYEIGNPRSYPSGPQKADGSPIPADDFVFPEIPSLLVSDIAKVGWWLSVGESTTNTTATSSTLEVSGSLGLGAFEFGAALASGEGRSHSIKVGETALFGGTVPPIVDDPATPEDEYLEYAFTFSPYVYRERWTDEHGDDAAYYVMSFAVAQ